MLVKTSELQRVTSLALSGCGQNAQVPVTQVFGLKTWVDEETNAKTLVVCATDTINFIYVKLPVDSDEDFDICVNASTLANLVSKFTTPDTSIEFVHETGEEKAHLLVRGNGEYKLAIVLFDNGYPMQLPDDGNFSSNECGEFNPTVLVPTKKFRTLETFAKASLSTMESEVDLNGYFVGDSCSIATDRQTMAIINDPIGLGIVLRPKFVELLAKSKQEEVLVDISPDGTCIHATDGETEFWSSQNSRVEHYPSKQIEALVHGSSFEFGCIVDPQAMAEALDRVSLMVTKYDSDLIDIVVAGGMMLVSSIKGTGSECIEIEPIDAEHPIDEEFSWSGRTNCKWLIEQLNTFAEEQVQFWVGDKKSVKICSGYVEKLVCLA